MTLLPRTRQLACSACLLLAACTNATSNDSPSAAATGNDGYGQALIGYKNNTGATSEDATSPEYGATADAGYGGMSGSGGAMSTGGSGGSGGMAGGSGEAGTGATGGSGGTAGTAGEAGSGPAGSAGSAGQAGSPEGHVVENPFWTTAEAAVSTFSIDADSGSYTLTRAAVRDGVLPNPESVRVEEFLNYFHFHYAQPEADIPLAMYTELGACPWNPQHELLLIGIQGQEVDAASAPPANLVYLLDVSGSMSEASKLPLLKRGFRMLTGQLRAQDRVSIVTYAGQESVVLEGVTGDQKDVIDDALAALESGGSTNGEGGIQKAYQLAEKYFIEGGTNRVLLATDGDFNVGLSDVDALVDLIATKRQTGVFLSVYGFGSAWDGGNYQDEVAEQLADNGNGVYFFIDGEEEARRAFIYTLSGSLITVAKDVKLQVEFNPERVAGYRLIGYENRLLANNDFSNDSVDAGELGASMSVTALYELVPPGTQGSMPAPIPGTVPEIPESDPTTVTDPEPQYPPLSRADLAQIRIRYKDSDSDVSKLLVTTEDRSMWRDQSSAKFMFAAGVAEFAMTLRGSQYLPMQRGFAIRDQILLASPLDGEGAVSEAGKLVGDALLLQ
jgi:Ca-activated chloride channel family protein